MLLTFWNYSTRSASRGSALLQSSILPKSNKIIFLFLFLSFFSVSAQQKDSLKPLIDTVPKTVFQTRATTSISGRVVDEITGEPLSFITVSFTGTRYGKSTDMQGKFALSAPGSFTHVTFSFVGYQSVTKIIKPGQANELEIRLHTTQTQLKEVKVTSGKGKRYRNKGNPAVELIQEIINHKDQNRMESAEYLQSNQYERIGLTLFHIPPSLINNGIFRKFKFMIDTVPINGKPESSLPVYMSEKLSQNYYRKNPEKAIRILSAEKATNILKFIDTVGLDTYLNRLYGNTIDIYTNNIFIISNQFLSPIADHAPDFYKFFITDTIKNGNEKLVEVSFTPRNKGDLLFEGKLLVTLDGRYAVKACELNVNKQININFMRSLNIRLDFLADNGRYYLKKSNVKADFGILRDRGMGVTGERSVFYDNYKLNAPQPAEFYEGKSLQILADANKPDTTYWQQHRSDTLPPKQASMYAKVNRLESMPSFKRLTWLAATFTGGFANVGPVEIGPIGNIYSFGNVEGSRFTLGGRTTPKLSKVIFLDGYGGYGLRDKLFKYNLNAYLSFNQTPPYRYPNNYLKVGYLYDIDVPGQTFSVGNAQAGLNSFHSGKIDYYIYSKIFKVDYVKEFENHFSFDLAVRNWNQQAAGSLSYRLNDANNTLVNNLSTSEVDLGLRFAPHEQLIQGTMYRRTIHSRYPIINLQINHAFKGVFNGSYSYTNITATVYKRFYMSQLGFSDITLLGNLLAGKVPFPLLNIAQANQSLAYGDDSYNRMNYLEFVSDHYVGVNLTHSFNGFFLNKIPLIEHLKLREFLSLKVLYGGVRAENNPALSKDLYRFPDTSNGANGTYALGNTPYTEAGLGIGNIFKLLRIDVIKRFNYLDHPNIAPYALKFSISPDL